MPSVKLAEAKKISDDIVAGHAALTAFPATGRPVHRRNTHKCEELYDLSAPRQANRPLAFVWNQVIHSYIFTLVLGEEHGLDSVMFCSDRDRQRFLYELKAGTVIALFEEVGLNDPASVHSKFNPLTQEWDVHVGPHLSEPDDDLDAPLARDLS